MLRRASYLDRPMEPTAPRRRPLVYSSPSPRARSLHCLSDVAANGRLHNYDHRVKAAFDRIVPVLQQLSALQHETSFIPDAQRLAREQLGFELPLPILEMAWVTQLDMRRLFAWCVFEVYEQTSKSFFETDPLDGAIAADFERLLIECGFHLLDITPCADGRLAHAIAFGLRIPFSCVRRRPHAGAMFDVENTVDRWVKTEHLRFREAKPNSAHEPTRYLKAVVYHFSSLNPSHEGCAAHASNDAAAAAAGMERLQAFRVAVENSFCCGASVDLLLLGIDTDTDAIRVHVPDRDSNAPLDQWLDAKDVYESTCSLSPHGAREKILQMVKAAVQGELDQGMARFIAQLLENNISQIDYVKEFHDGAYADAGHAERFIGVGIGFKEIHLRNLTYFAYVDTVEEGTADLDVGVKIFTGLNVSRGLPIPVVVRFDYRGKVPGARQRAISHGERVIAAIKQRYSDLYQQGLLHLLLSVRDRDRFVAAETVSSSITFPIPGGH